MCKHIWRIFFSNDTHDPLNEQCLSSYLRNFLFRNRKLFWNSLELRDIELTTTKIPGKETLSHLNVLSNLKNDSRRTIHVFAPSNVASWQDNSLFSLFRREWCSVKIIRIFVSLNSLTTQLSPGVDLGFCVTSSLTPLAWESSAFRHEIPRGVRGLSPPPRKILKSRVSEIAFPAFWTKILPNSNGQNLIHK